MRITGKQLRQIINEGLERTMSEADDSILDQVRKAAKILKANMDTGMYNPDPGVGTSDEAKETWKSSLKYGFKVYPGSIGGSSHLIVACVAEGGPIPAFGPGPFGGNASLKSIVSKIARDNGLVSLKPGEGRRVDRNNVKIYTDDGFTRDATPDDMLYSSVWAIAV